MDTLLHPTVSLLYYYCMQHPYVNVTIGVDWCLSKTCGVGHIKTIRKWIILENSECNGWASNRNVNLVRQMTRDYEKNAKNFDDNNDDCE